MPIDLNVNDPDQVASAQRLVATLDAGRDMIILSGIARCERQCTDDGRLYPDLVTVHFGEPAPRLEQASATVALASIHADDTNFVFAADSATVLTDESTGELQLKIDTNLMGDPARLSRLSYQVVVVVATSTSWVRGTVRWIPSRTGVQMPSADPVTLAALLDVDLTRVVTTSTPSSDGYSFWDTSYIPLAQAHLGSPGMDGDWVVVPFDVAHPPFGTPLAVRVAQGSAFGPRVVVSQALGPHVFQLAPTHETIDGLVFEISPFSVPK